MKFFINLPATNLSNSTQFFEALGFVKIPQFSDENASGLSYNNELYLMILNHAFFKSFLPHKEIADSTKTCEVMNALQCDSKQSVDEFFDKALKSGATTFRDPYDYGFMYGKAFQDLDGHIWEVFWMNPDHIQ